MAIVAALVVPGAPAAGASSGTASEGGRRVVLTARRVAPRAPITPRLDVRLIVTPVDGGDLAVYEAPGALAPSQVLPAVNELGSPLTLLAITADHDWYQVLLPTRPNGSTAWVPVSAVTATATEFRVELSLGTYELRVVRNADGAVVLTSPVGIGSPARPTPTGLFFVRDHFPTSGANHPYGPFAFGLSGHSDVLMQFGTGDGRIAIHGTNQPSTIGAAASNGCPHVPNDVVLALIPFLPLGTPVIIS